VSSLKWLKKKLTIILTSVLLLTMFGLEGYWLGTREQQPSSSDFLAQPKPSWVPSVTPVQQSSSASTVTPSQTDPAYNWKTYQEEGVPFTFQYPPQTEIRWDRNNLSVVSYSSHSGTIDAAIPTPGISFSWNILSNTGIRVESEYKRTCRIIY
jgi:hypothetical protein